MVRPGQVWITDITYIRLARGFAYLVVIIDWYSRRVLSWRIGNSMDAAFCVDCLEEALRTHGKPEIFNSDQGSQFTSVAFIDVLKREGVSSAWMGGDERSTTSLNFAFYNSERPHQSLGQRTPDTVYRTAAIGGGDGDFGKYPRAVEETPVPLRSTGFLHRGTDISGNSKG